MKSAWSLIEEKLEGWWEYSIRMLPNFILAILVLLIFFGIAKIARRIAYKFILKFSTSISVSSLLSGILSMLIIAAGLMSALDILELDKTVASLLAGVGIIGLALGFAFQDITSNFIAGAFIALKRPFDVGHVVETNGFTGTIEEIRLRSTTLRTYAGLYVIIPNKDIFQKPIINYTRTDSRKVEVEFMIPTSVDAIYVEKLVGEAIESISTKNSFKDIELYFTAIEGASMKVHVGFWTHRIEPGPFMKARHRALIAIYKTFRDNGIYQVTISAPSAEEGKTPDQNG